MMHALAKVNISFGNSLRDKIKKAIVLAYKAGYFSKRRRYIGVPFIGLLTRLIKIISERFFPYQEQRKLVMLPIYLAGYSTGLELMFDGSV